MTDGRFIASLLSDAALAVMGGVLSAVALPWPAAALTSTGFLVVASFGALTKYLANRDQQRRESEHAGALAAIEAQRARAASLLESTSQMVTVLVETQGLRNGALRGRIASVQQQVTRYYESRTPFRPSSLESDDQTSYGAQMRAYGEAMQWSGEIAKGVWNHAGAELRVIQAMLRERGFIDHELDQQIDCLERGTIGFDVSKMSERLAHIASVMSGA